MSNNSCKNCHLHLLMENKRIDWFNELSLKNIQLLKELRKQEENIIDAEKKIANRNTKLIENSTSTLANYLKLLLAQVETEKDDKHEIVYHLKHALRKYDDVLNSWGEQYRRFDAALLQKENDFSSKLVLFEEMLEYYRESLFDEMKQFHEIKAVLSEEASKLQSKIKTNKVVNITDNKSSELYKKYKALLKQNQSELKMKEDLIDKLRADRKMLYIKISKIKQENEEKESASKSEIEKLKVSLNHWRDKYNKLENRRKLELTRSGIV